VSSEARRWLLSGGLGSGKSEVRRLLERAGVVTIDSDFVGHAVLEPEGPAFAEVAARWPSTLVRGRIDRRVLGAIVFSDETELRRLESITHPHIFGTIEAEVEGIGGPVVVEVPVLNERLGGGWRRMVVDSDDSVRLERAMARGLTEFETRDRMSRQPTRAQWLASADLVLPNHDDLAALARTVDLALTVISG